MNRTREVGGYVGSVVAIHIPLPPQAPVRRNVAAVELSGISWAIPLTVTITQG